jgi:hypothetical protein
VSYLPQTGYRLLGLLELLFKLSLELLLLLLKFGLRLLKLGLGFLSLSLDLGFGLLEFALGLIDFGLGLLKFGLDAVFGVTIVIAAARGRTEYQATSYKHCGKPQRRSSPSRAHVRPLGLCARPTVAQTVLKRATCWRSKGIHGLVLRAFRRRVNAMSARMRTNLREPAKGGGASEGGIGHASCRTFVHA